VALTGTPNTFIVFHGAPMTALTTITKKVVDVGELARKTCADLARWRVLGDAGTSMVTEETMGQRYYLLSESLNSTLVAANPPSRTVGKPPRPQVHSSLTRHRPTPNIPLSPGEIPVARVINHPASRIIPSKTYLQALTEGKHKTPSHPLPFFSNH
jgi:hypothetical protein